MTNLLSIDNIIALNSEATTATTTAKKGEKVYYTETISGSVAGIGQVSLTLGKEKKNSSVWWAELGFGGTFSPAHVALDDTLRKVLEGSCSDPVSINYLKVVLTLQGLNEKDASITEVIRPLSEKGLELKVRNIEYLQALKALRKEEEVSSAPDLF